MEPPRPATPPPPPVPPAPPFWRTIDWENIVGVKLFTGIGAVAFVLAMILLLKYSAEHGLLRPPFRAAIGLLTGGALIFVCELRIARNYKVTANALHGAGIATLYATLFASYARWHLAPATLVFGLMIVVTAVAVWLSIRRESVFIALLGLLGGFATPAMLSTGENRPFGLFTYLLLLNIGLAWVAMRRRWTLLTAISLGFTVAYQWGWIAKYLTPAQLPVAVGVFLVFAAAAGVTLWMSRRNDGAQATFDRIAIMGAAFPLLFGVFIAAVPAYGSHFHILFGFLLLICGGLAAIAITRGPSWLHQLGAATAVLVFALWRIQSFTAAAWPAILGWIAAFVLLYVAVAVRQRSRAVFAAPLLLFLFPTFINSGDYAANPWLLFGVLFGLLAAVAAYAVVFEEGLVYYIGTFAAITAEALWSAQYLGKTKLLSGLALYGLFALFYLGVPLIAQRLKRRLDPPWAFTALLLASIGMLFFLDGSHVADSALWGLTLLVSLLNAGALLQAHRGRFPLLSVGAAILSWLVIAAWWSAATITATVGPALFVVGGFAILIVAGNVLARTGSEQSAGAFEGSTYLGLAGHLFLFFVAAHRELALPPWPLFGVLFVLQLAVGVAALWMRRPRLLTVASASSQVVLFIWAISVAHTAWPLHGMVATLVIMAMTLIWFRIDRRFAESVFGAFFAGQVAMLLLGESSQPHVLWQLLTSHILLLVALMAVTWLTERHVFVTIAAITSGVALANNAELQGATQELILAGAVYAVFLAYPLLLGRRAKQSLHPYLSAIIASGVFFAFGHHALVTLGYKGFIGALPLFQAVLVVVLLLRLLQIERNLDRLLSRLALVAGAALAFITLAIPLQLEKQWITIGWALEGAALIWLYRRIPHRGLLIWGGGLLAAVFVHLTLNRAVLDYHPPGKVAILNWYLYTYLTAAGAMFLAAVLMPALYKRVAAALHAGGTILLFFLVNIEIADYFSNGPVLTFNFLSSSLRQDLMYTMGWALFAITLLVAGIVFRTRAARVASIALLVVTILKCFLHDLGRLAGLYRIGSLFGLAISLVVVGILLQKFVLGRTDIPEAPAT